MKEKLHIMTLFVSCCLFSNVAISGVLEDTVKYRQGMMGGVGWNVGLMGAMVKGDAPFDREKFIFFASRTSLLIPMVVEGFTEKTKDLDSNVKPKIWSNLDDFNEKMSNLGKEASELLKVAEEGTESEIKKQFGTTVKQCKGCHDLYKESG